MIGIDAKLVGHCGSGGAGFTAQEVPDLLARYAARLAERFKRSEPLSEFGLDVLTVNGDQVHGA